jgi:Flp pilus assembly protein CpaB
LSAGLVAAAAAVGMQMAKPATPASTSVVVAAHDIPAGQRLTASDLRASPWRPGTAPDERVRDVAAAVGRVSAGVLTAGSPVTTGQLLGPGLLHGQAPGLLAVPVRVPGAGATGLVHRGDRVDVLLGGSGDGGAGVGGVGGSGSGGVEQAASGGTVVRSAVVLAQPGRAGTTLILGVSSGDAERLARAQAAGPLSVAVHAG